MSRLAILKANGFDLSRQSRDDFGQFSARCWVRCSQCEALVVNGYPSHERGCPNESRKAEEEV